MNCGNWDCGRAIPFLGIGSLQCYNYEALYKVIDFNEGLQYGISRQANLSEAPGKGGQIMADR
jgi:hypothetical protein